MCKSNFVEKCCQEIKLKMILLRKLEILTFLRIVVTYHFGYTAAALNPVVFFSGKYLQNWDEMTLHYILNYKNIKVALQKCGDGLSYINPKANLLSDILPLK